VAGAVPISLHVAPIAPDGTGDWRALQAELAGPRRITWVQSQRRRGIRREVVWLDSLGSTAYYAVEGIDPDHAFADLDRSDDFEGWLAGHLERLHPDGIVPVERVFDSSPAPGAWRGLPNR